MRACYLYYTVELTVTESERKLRSEKYAMLHYNVWKKLTAAAQFIIPVRIVHNMPTALVLAMISKILSAAVRRWSDCSMLV